MKNFRIYNCNYEDSKTKFFVHASDAFNFLTVSGWINFEISWKTPLTKEYATLLTVENGKTVYINHNFNIPVVFQKLAKKYK